ncbi:MAG: hypothetical protein AABX29_04255 [Nanoarchaeota archaeon]
MTKQCCLDLVAEDQFSGLIACFIKERDEAFGNYNLFLISRNMVLAHLLRAGLEPPDIRLLNMGDVEARRYKKKTRITLPNEVGHVIRINGGEVFNVYDDDRFWFLDDLITRRHYPLRIDGSCLREAYLINGTGKRITVREIEQVSSRLDRRFAIKRGINMEATARYSKVAV